MAERVDLGQQVNQVIPSSMKSPLQLIAPTWLFGFTMPLLGVLLTQIQEQYPDIALVALVTWLCVGLVMANIAKSRWKEFFENQSYHPDVSIVIFALGTVVCGVCGALVGFMINASIKQWGV
jgi:hypothetical protein